MSEREIRFARPLFSNHSLTGMTLIYPRAPIRDSSLELFHVVVFLGFLGRWFRMFGWLSNFTCPLSSSLCPYVFRPGVYVSCPGNNIFYHIRVSAAGICIFYPVFNLDRLLLFHLVLLFLSPMKALVEILDICSSGPYLCYDLCEWKPIFEILKAIATYPVKAHLIAVDFLSHTGILPDKFPYMKCHLLVCFLDS